MFAKQLGLLHLSIQEWSLNKFIGIITFAIVIVHHILIQYPYQARFLTSIYVYIAGHVFFLLSLHYIKLVPVSLEMLKSLYFFNFFYVFSICQSHIKQYRLLEHSLSN